ncbi:MAG: N-6 DNA methylase [Myxococcales bacterium]|nr:N-6 DNA methylase [Myxococcales bacterium]
MPGPRRQDLPREQRALLRLLLDELGYPMRQIQFPDPGRVVVRDGAGRRPPRLVGVHLDAARGDYGPAREDARARLHQALVELGASGGFLFTAREDEALAEPLDIVRRVVDDAHAELAPWPGLPACGDSWDTLGPRERAALRPPGDVTALLRRCHDRLHGRGSESDEEDLAMDMVRVLLAKAHDERQVHRPLEFRCAPQEFRCATGRSAVAARISALFDAVKAEHPTLFRAHERISVGPRALCDVVVALQPYRVVPDPARDDVVDPDIIGRAYEEYTARHMKRKRGQFFTNPLVTRLLVTLVAPREDDVVLDPAGGSGGFLSAALRHVRAELRARERDPEARARRLETFAARLHMSDISRRLVKIARAAMILSGAPAARVTQGDGLGEYDALDPKLLELAGPSRPTVILTNPPFAGVGEGKISQPETLRRFACGHRWVETQRGHEPGDALVSEGVPPELLFFERCVDWLAPGGRLAVVLPKSFLDTATYLPARRLLLRRCQLLAVINCHRHTFQPHTGVRTCLVVARKRLLDEQPDDDERIFMAVSHKVGQDSEGLPIYRRDAQGAPLPELEEDLTSIARAFAARREAPASEHAFTIRRGQLDDELRVNPQAFLPSLNATLRAVMQLDERAGWAVLPLAELHPALRVFKGPRLRSEPLIVAPVELADARARGAAIEPYFTPSAIQQEKSDSVKHLDTGRADERQRRTLAAIRVRRGDILISRSGSVGRVSIVTRKHDGALVSDDMIRVRAPDPFTRAYLYAYLQSAFAQDQLSRNEYGAIQQHIEPQHVRDLLVPIPHDRERVADVVAHVDAQIEHREALDAADAEARGALLRHLAP